MITGVEHIAIASFSPHQLERWYVENLSLAEALDTGETVYLRAPNRVVLELVPGETQPTVRSIRDAGIRHIAFSVKDLEAARKPLKSQGIVFENESIILRGLLTSFFRDPKGNFLHLMRERHL